MAEVEVIQALERRALAFGYRVEVKVGEVELRRRSRSSRRSGVAAVQVSLKPITGGQRVVSLAKLGQDTIGALQEAAEGAFAHVSDMRA
jgi:hypothetical protein